MRRICLFLFVAFWPMVGAAVPLRVQTGEHADFTRVVVGIPEGADWQLGRTAEGYALRIPTAEGFALDRFFDLIPKDRIAAVSQDPSRGELRLRVGCTCYARASVYESGALVIDISDGPAPRDAPFEQALPDAMMPASVPAPDDLPRWPYRPDQNRLLPLVTPRFAMPNTDQPRRDTTLQSATVPAPAPQIAEQEDTDKALQMIVRSLSESLGRGLTEGLLQEGLRPKGETEAAAERFGPPPKHTDDALPGVNARTSIDPMAVPDTATPPQTQVGQTCMPAPMFDVASWGSERPPHEQLTDARNSLINPVDKFEDGALLRLARVYVFLGFGREAQQALDLEGVQSRDRVMLRAIAQMVDNEPVAQELFSGQVSCPTNVALWALLAQTSAPTDAQVDRTAVINAYRALPVFVQQAVAPRLAEALLAVGAQDEAMQVLDRQATGDEKSTDRLLAEASLADALGEDAQAIETVAAVARNAPRSSPEAMARFFFEGTATKLAFSDKDFVLADALRFENAGTLAADRLAEAQFGAYLSVGRFGDARSLLVARQAGLSPVAMAASRAALFGQAAERMPDAAFLTFIWQEDAERMDAETRFRVAERLLELGFPDRALSFLATAAEGVEDGRLRGLRSLARQRSAAMQPSSEDAAMRLGKMEQPAAPEAGDVAVFSAAEGPTLRNSRALVDDAAQSRARIRALLQTVPAPANF